MAPAPAPAALAGTENFPDDVDIDVRVALVRALGLPKAKEVAEVLAREQTGTLKALDLLSDEETKELRVEADLNIGQMAKLKRACAEARVISRLKGEEGTQNGTLPSRLCGTRLCSPASWRQCTCTCTSCSTEPLRRIPTLFRWRKSEDAPADDKGESLLPTKAVASDATGATTKA